MGKVAVVFWSGSGNTEAMANAIADGAKGAGAEVSVIEAENFSDGQVAEYDALAFGCPAMGDEELEDTIFEPMFSQVEASLKDKKVAIFGSYGWGDGDWMRSWEERCKNAGISLVAEGLILNETPDDDGLEQCKKLGASLN